MFTNQIYRRIFLSTFALMAALALASCAMNLPPADDDRHGTVWTD